MIELNNIGVTFGKKDKAFHAVKNINLQINEGEIFGIVGPSGAGKSTLVRVINLLQAPSSGKILIRGKDITTLKGKALRKVRLKIGMIFQHFNLINQATVYDNIAFALLANEYPKVQIKNKVIELLELVNLNDKMYAYPSNLSGGQKQRVAIARALANNPEILLCDEATSALDLENTEEVVETLRKIKQKYRITIVFITHEMDVAKKLFDRIAVMNQGELVEINDTYSIFTKPLHPITQSLVSRVLNIEVPEQLQLAPDEELLKLSYVGETAYAPVISYISSTYKISVNIIHGKIEYIHDKPFGILILKIEGQAAQRDKAKDYIEKNVYNVKSLPRKGVS